MILIAALTAGLTVFVLVRALTAGSRTQSVNVRLGRLERDLPLQREELLAAPLSARVGRPLANRAQRFAGAFLPTSIMNSLERRLAGAGAPVSFGTLLVFQLTFTALAVVVAIFAVANATSAIQVLAMLGLAAALVIAPSYWLRIKGGARRKAILRALPDAVDLIVTTVEAGMSIDAALAEVGRETAGPLGEELRLAVRETTLGRSRRDALKGMIDRAQVPEFRSFVQSIIQAEQTGIPIGDVLRTQAGETRLKRRQHAEADAQRAPVKMIVVLVTLVLPAMILTIIGPAILRIGSQI